MNQIETMEYGSVINGFLTTATNTMKSLHAEEEICFIRIRSVKHEIMIAPEKEFSLIVLQNPSNDDTN